jgi:hypothetical protein
MPRGLFPWLLAAWGDFTFVALLGLGIAFAAPVAGLPVLALTWPVGALIAYRAPDSYRDWA